MFPSYFNVYMEAYKGQQMLECMNMCALISGSYQMCDKVHEKLEQICNTINTFRLSQDRKGLHLMKFVITAFISVLTVSFFFFFLREKNQSMCF